MSASFNTPGQGERRPSTQRGYSTQVTRGYSQDKVPKPPSRRHQNPTEKPPNPEISHQNYSNNFNYYLQPRPPPIDFEEGQEFSYHYQGCQNYNAGIFGYQNFFDDETPHQNRDLTNHYQPKSYSLQHENLDLSRHQFRLHHQERPSPPVREPDIAPDADKRSVESEEDDEEEEGEIDEEEEDVARLYDDFEDAGLGSLTEDIKEKTTCDYLPDSSNSAKKRGNEDDNEVDSAREDLSQLHEDVKEKTDKGGIAENPDVKSDKNRDDDSDYDAMFGGEEDDDDDDDDAEINMAELEESSPIRSQEHGQVDNIDKQITSTGNDLCQEPSSTVKEDDEIIEMFGDISDGEDSIDGTEQPLSKTEPTNSPASSLHQDNDELEMFHCSSDEEDDEVDARRKEGPSTQNPNAREFDSLHVDIAEDREKLNYKDVKKDTKQEVERASGPMSAAEALASARRNASIPKLTRHGLSKSTRHSLLSKITPRNTPQGSPPKLAPNQSISAKSILLPAQSELPKRSYYQSVHPDKYWSTIRNWDFIRDINEEMKNSNASTRKTPDTKAQKRTIDDTSNEKVTSNAQARDNTTPDLTKSLPDAFDSVSQYKALWAPLLINEAKAQIMSDVVAAQSSPTTAWIQRTQLAFGASVKLETARSVKELPPSDILGSNLSSTNSTSSMEPTVALQVRPIIRGAGIGSPVCTHDLLLFARQPTTIELALRGKAFNALDAGSVGVVKLGRMGFIGHALNSRNRSIDGLIVRVSKKCWDQFSSLEEVFMIKIGSNITALREFNALSRADSIPLTKYLLDGKVGDKDSIQHDLQTSSQFDPLAASGNALPVGFRIFIKSKMNTSQLAAITAAAREYGDGGFTLIKGPPGTGKSTTLVSVLNALHLRQYQAYYAAIERIVTESNPTTHFEELAALNQAAEVKPRILVCAPSNAAIDNVIVKIMSDRFVDGNGAKYSPSIVRVGAGIVNPKVKSVGLKEMVDSITTFGSDVSKLDAIITAGRQELRRIQKEIQKLKIRIQAIVNACPYEIPDCWEIRIDEESFEATGSVLFVNHKSKKTTYDLPMVKRPTERPCQIKKMPHYVELLKNLTKYVERHNIETSNLEKYIILQNAANAKMEGGSSYNESTLIQELETHVLNTNHIVLTTLGSSGSRVVADANKFEVVVIDEAAQSSEPSTLVALQLGSSHAILVGDPQQLPATIFSVSGRNTKYDRSLFQRLEECGHPVHMLNTQYRMHPVISAFPRHIFYDGMLQDGSNVKRPDFGGKLVHAVKIKFPNFQPFNIFDLDSKEERDGTSLSNIDEAQLVLHLYRTLDRETDGMLTTTRVAVITPYSQQTILLHRLFENAYGMSYASRVEISTVDAFQGREAVIVIYSCVRAGRASGIGFLSDVQRMNVALTRAQNFLFVIARRRSIMVNPYWRKLVGYARERSAIIHVPLDRRKGHHKAPNEVVFPELPRLAPVHRTSDIGAMSDSEYSA